MKCPEGLVRLSVTDVFDLVVSVCRESKLWLLRSVCACATDLQLIPLTSRQQHVVQRSAVCLFIYSFKKKITTKKRKVKAKTFNITDLSVFSYPRFKFFINLYIFFLVLQNIFFFFILITSNAS